MKKNNYGRCAEEYVCVYLEQDGYAIIERNFKAKGGEVDIIAQKGYYICFVEIKYRINASGLETAIDRKKQRRIVKSAELYIRRTGCKLQPRFDAAFVNSHKGESMSLEYFPNAYDGSCY